MAAFSDLVTTVKTQHGVDATDVEVKAALNDRYVELVVRSRYRMAETAIGTTVSGTSNYDLPSTIADLDTLRVGSSQYHRCGQRDLWDLKYDQGRWLAYGVAGVFAPDWTSAGTPQVELYPVPSTSGDAITGLCAIEPTALSADSDVPAVPQEYHAAIADGAASRLILRYDERPDIAQGLEQQFQAAITALRARKNSRVGSGPVQIQVKGFHW